MGLHAVLTTVAVVAAISLAVLSQQVQEQDEEPPARASEDLLAAIEAARAKLRALDEPADIRTNAEQAALFHTAAEQGNADAQFALGMMHTNGEGVPQNYAEAVIWFRLAAEQGHAWAQTTLGVMYLNGRGVPQDDVEAVTWWRKAAEQGHAWALATLGASYDTGRGVPQDNVEAHTWLNLAASRLTGEQREEVVTARDRVAERMTPADLSEAQRRAREWNAAHQAP